MRERATATAILLCGAFMLVAFPGCSRKEEQTTEGAETKTVGTAIVPNASVGPIRAGMTTQELFAALGQPQRRTANALDYPKLGLAVVPSPEGIAQVVMCGDVIGLDGPYVRAFTGRTPEGIGMRSTREEVVKAYGRPSETRGNPGGTEALKYEALGMVFRLQANKVHHIAVVLRGKDQPQEPSVGLDLVPAPSPEPKK
jgi:hypothetical protein